MKLNEFREIVFRFDTNTALHKVFDYFLYFIYNLYNNVFKINFTNMKIIKSKTIQLQGLNDKYDYYISSKNSFYFVKQDLLIKNKNMILKKLIKLLHKQSKDKDYLLYYQLNKKKLQALLNNIVLD